MPTASLCVHRFNLGRRTRVPTLTFAAVTDKTGFWHKDLDSKNPTLQPVLTTGPSMRPVWQCGARMAIQLFCGATGFFNRPLPAGVPRFAPWGEGLDRFFSHPGAKPGVLA